MKDMAVLVEVFTVKSRQEIIDLYIEINKAQPVQVRIHTRTDDSLDKGCRGISMLLRTTATVILHLYPISGTP